MTTIDHAAEAQIRINFSHKSPPNDPISQTYMMQAQVHATLALVEQQRIANLIAVFQMEGGPYKETNRWATDEEDANAIIVRDIKKGLGL